MRHWLFVFLAALSFALLGCGGGGGGSSATGDVNFFATDDLSTNYSAVWVKIYKMQLRTSSDTFVTIFDDANGQVINLRALNDGAERYAFLGSKGVPQGNYTGIRIELDRAVTLFPTGSSTGQNRVFDDAYGAVRTQLDLLFGSVKTVGSADTNFVCDFDLGAWEDIGGEIRNAILDDSPGNGLGDQNRHESEDYGGTIAALAGTAPNFTFLLSTSSNTKIEVETNADTVIFNRSGQPSPTLANGKRVEVRGKFDTISGRLVATSVKIKDTSGDDDFEVKGEPSQANEAGRTFKLSTRECSGFLPGGSTVNILVTDTTRFVGEHGMVLTEAQFFDLLPVDGALEVEAEGEVYNAETMTLTANKCKIEVENGGGDHEAEARGGPSNLSPGAGTFDIALTSWEGFSGSAGQIVHITTNAETVYKDGNNVHISQAVFFELLATAPSVKVEGIYGDGTIAAHDLSLRVNEGGGGGENPQEIKGPVSSISLATRSFTVAILEWEGFSGTIGQLIQVTMNESATYRSNEGTSLTIEQFFAEISGGWFAEVDGTLTGSNLAGAKAKLDD